ncbi:hypothetical protein ACOMHN_037237 [Nucella lapillus]
MSQTDNVMKVTVTGGGKRSSSALKTLPHHHQKTLLSQLAVLDGAAVMQMLPPRPGCKTLQDYTEKVFKPSIHHHLDSCTRLDITRLDIIWDRYKSDSLKAGTRQKRGKGIGKKTAWEIWNVFPTVSIAFKHLAAGPSEIDKADFETLEHFVVLLIDKSCSNTSVNTTRKKLFAKGRLLERIPPTPAALVQHTKRAVLQGGHCWQNTSHGSGPSQSFTVGLEVESIWSVDSILVRLARSDRHLQRN